MRERARAQAQQAWFDRYRHIPGEYQFEDYNDQEGMGEGFVTWSWNKEMRRVHCGLIRNAKSYVVEDVEKHEVLADKLAILFDTTEVRKRERVLWERKLQKENLHMLKNISNMQKEVTDIGETLNPEWRKKQVEKALEHTKHLRIARQVELDSMNADNRQLLKFLSKAKPYYSNKDQESHWKRHVRLRKAMRKVMPKKKKKKKKAKPSPNDVSDTMFTLDKGTPRLLPIGARGRRGRTPSVQTRGEVVLANMYQHAFANAGLPGSTAGEIVSRATTPATRNAGQRGPTATPSQSALGALGMSAYSNALRPSSSAKGMSEALLDGHYDVGDEQNMLMAPKQLMIGGRHTMMSVFRTSSGDGSIKFKCEDVSSGNVRAVYVLPSEIRRVCDSNSVLFNTKSSKLNRFERVALLLDLEGAFDGKLRNMRKAYNEQG